MVFFNSASRPFGNGKFEAPDKYSKRGMGFWNNRYDMDTIRTFSHIHGLGIVWNSVMPIKTGAFNGL